MTEITTNRDLYCFIAALVKQYADNSVTLQDYLESLGQLGRQWCERSAVLPSEFAHLLEASFAPVPTGIESKMNPTAGYLIWQQRIAEQVRDLSEMKEAGTLENQYRYFGVAAPRGAHWFNFDPCTYLECAAAGTFGGWREGDDTERTYVPGEVAVLDASGELTTADPRDLDNPVVRLPEITWEMFVDFLNAGQFYE
jgi:hypothetical protein